MISAKATSSAHVEYVTGGPPPVLPEELAFADPLEVPCPVLELPAPLEEAGAPPVDVLFPVPEDPPDPVRELATNDALDNPEEALDELSELPDAPPSEEPVPVPVPALPPEDVIAAAGPVVAAVEAPMLEATEEPGAGPLEQAASARIAQNQAKRGLGRGSMAIDWHPTQQGDNWGVPRTGCAISRPLLRKSGGVRNRHLRREVARGNSARPNGRGGGGVAPEDPSHQPCDEGDGRAPRPIVHAGSPYRLALTRSCTSRAAARRADRHPVDHPPIAATL